MRTSLCPHVLASFLQFRITAFIVLLVFVLGGVPRSFADTHTVTIHNFAFTDTASNTSTTIIRVGDTVQWNWSSGTHSTTSGTCSGACTPNNMWDSGQKSSGSFSLTFNQVGVFPYYCSVHLASMTGVVIVRPAPGPFVLQVSPSNFSLVPLHTMQFNASRLFFRNGTQSAFGENVTGQVQWSTSDANKATVNPSTGLVTAGSTTGAVMITATKGPLSASVQLNINNTPVLNSITVTPGGVHKLLGTGTVAYTATGNFSDGSTPDLTGTVTWTSSQTGVATMAGNVATPVAAGSTVISATSGSVTGSTGLQVIVLSSITVTPANLHVLLSAGTVTYTAIGNYSDGTTQDLTGTATWASSMSAIATMTNNVATLVAPGITSISAKSQGVTGATNLQVIVLSSITVTPANPTVVVNAGPVTFTATGNYSDGSTQNLTNTAAWASSMTGVATMANNVATLVAPGSTNISATQGVVGSTSLQVVPVLTVSPVTVVISVSQTQQFTANLPVSWSVDGVAGGNSTVGTISNTGLYTPTVASIGPIHTITANTSSPPAQQRTASIQVNSGFGGILTYHNDSARTGWNSQEVFLTTTNVNQAHFRRLFTIPVDGKVDAQTLYVPGVNIPSVGIRNVLYVATEHDSVYAFDADTGTQYWQVTMLKGGEVPSDDRGCGQVTPEIGVTSTPAIDLSMGPNGIMYVVAMSKDASSNYFQRLHALDLTTGADMLGGPVDIHATYPKISGTTTFDPKKYKERTGLLLLNGKIYTAWASHCDAGPYTAWIMSFDKNSLAQTNVIDLTPNGSEAAMWNSGEGVAADSSGNIYVTTGNGTFDTTLDGNGFPNHGDYGNAFVKLSAASNGLSVTDYFTMSDTVSESNGDTDLGSGGYVVLPDMTDGGGNTRHLITGAGKDGRIYLIDRDNMGKFNAGNNNGNAYQVLNGALPNGIWSTPAYFNGMVYYGAQGGPLRAFSFSSARLNSPAASHTSINFAYPGSSPSVSSNGTTNGIVWAMESPDGGSTVLHAYDATNLATELYNSNQAGSRDNNFGPGNKFMTPTIANGKVYAGTQNSVGVFGLF